MTPKSNRTDAIAPKRPPGLQGIVLSGVYGWGSSPLERVCFPPLLPIGGRPLISFLLDWLHDAGVAKVSICANGNSRGMAGVLGERYHGTVDLHFYEDRMPRGPAGCVRDAGLDMEGEVFIVCEGRLLPRFDISGLVAKHAYSGAAMTVLAACSGSGCFASGRFHEPLGIYIVSRAALQFVPERGYQDIKELWIPRLHERGETVLAEIIDDDAVIHARSTPGYLEVHERVIAGFAKAQGVTSAYRRQGSAVIHERSRVDATVTFNGPVVVGPDCTIGRLSKIIGPTSIGKGTQIGPRSIVSRSMLWCNCHIGEGVIMDRCIFTAGAIADAGLVLRDAIVEATGSSARHAGHRADLYWALPGHSHGTEVAERGARTSGNSPQPAGDLSRPRVPGIATATSI